VAKYFEPHSCFHLETLKMSTENLMTTSLPTTTTTTTTTTLSLVTPNKSRTGN
jgi:hypothetical protein